MQWRFISRGALVHTWASMCEPTRVVRRTAMPPPAGPPACTERARTDAHLSIGDEGRNGHPGPLPLSAPTTLSLAYPPIQPRTTSDGSRPLQTPHGPYLPLSGRNHAWSAYLQSAGIFFFSFSFLACIIQNAHECRGITGIYGKHELFSCNNHQWWNTAVPAEFC